MWMLFSHYLVFIERPTIAYCPLMCCEKYQHTAQTHFMIALQLRRVSLTVGEVTTLGRR